MAARIRGFRTVAGLHTLIAVGMIASAGGTSRPAAAEQAWAGRTVRSVVVRQGSPTIVEEGGLVVPESTAIESVSPRVVEEHQFDGSGDSQGMIIEDGGVSADRYGADGILVHDGATACGPQCMPGCPHCMAGHAKAVQAQVAAAPFEQRYTHWNLQRLHKAGNIA